VLESFRKRRITDASIFAKWAKLGLLGADHPEQYAKRLKLLCYGLIARWKWERVDSGIRSMMKRAIRCMCRSTEL